MRKSVLRCIDRQIIIYLLIAGIFLIVSGCGLKEVKKQTGIADNLGLIKGEVTVTSDQEGPVVVVHLEEEDGILFLKHNVTPSRNGKFEFPVTPGKHYVAAYIDVNGDKVYQPGEHGNYYGSPTAIDIIEKQVVTIDILISGTPPKPSEEYEVIDKRVAAWKNIGQVVTLDDPRFALENYTMGLWKPLDFLEKAEGGLFFLEEYQENKIPVLFIHGVVNGPTLWKDVIASLDKEHFQPWLYYYPSGLRLDIISNFLVNGVDQLHDKYRFKEFYVVAHSMGGLVARSFVKKYVEESPEHLKILSLGMTINSPMNGMSAAASGVKHSPIVVPSWRDVQPGSTFLQDIHAWDWPKDIEYHLVISYFNNTNGDGVVPLASQAQLKLQSEATRIYVFNNEHTETINDKDFHAILNQVLENKRND